MASCAGALEVRVVDVADETVEPVDRRHGALVIADLQGRDGRGEQQLGACDIIQAVGAALHLGDPGTTFGHAASHLPEQPQDAEHVREWCDVVREEPADGDPDVLLVGPHALGPLGLSFRGPVGVRHQRAEVPCVPRLDVGEILAVGEALGGELPHGGQHVEPRPGVHRVDGNEAVARQRVEQIERLVLGQTCDVHRGLDLPPVDEDRQRGQHPLLDFFEEPEAPLDRRPQRSLPFGEIDRAGAQGVEAAFQAAPARRLGPAPGSERRPSSMASGRPSTSRQISATATTLSSVRAKLWRIACARSTKSRTAGSEASSSVGEGPRAGAR